MREELLSAYEVAERLGLSVKSVYRLADEGKLSDGRDHAEGRYRRWPKGEVEALTKVRAKTPKKTGVRNRGRERVHLATTVDPATLAAIDRHRAANPHLWALGRAIDDLVAVAVAATNSAE